MKNLKLGFTDTYDNAKNFFTDILGRHYNIIRDDNDPDYLIFGDHNFGESHYNYTRAKKIFFTGENIRPNYYTYNHAMTFDHENSPKHYRLPLYVLEMWAIAKDSPQVTQDYYYLINKHVDAEAEWNKKFRFASYIQSNPNCQLRTQFVEFMIKNRSVDSGGPHMNTIGKIIPRDRQLKINFFNEAKFGIAFENGSQPGYVTEKLIDCYYSNTVPIYWGSATVSRDFNPRSYINAGDFKNFSDLLEYLRALSQNKNEYLDILTAPAFNGNVPNEWTNINSFIQWFDTFVYEG